MIVAHLHALEHGPRERMTLCRRKRRPARRQQSRALQHIRDAFVARFRRGDVPADRPEVVLQAPSGMPIANLLKAAGLVQETPEVIAAWAAARRGRIELTASGGIKTLGDARALLAAGATRLGTSNAASILAEFTGSAPAAAPSAGY